MYHHLFHNQFRVTSTRYPDWDYSHPGGYFITICIKNKQCVLGKIVDGKMQLSPIGIIVQREWLKTGIIRPNIRLDEYIIMPNHLHGIVFIHYDGFEPNTVETPRRGVSTNNIHHNPQWKPNSVGSIICQFKSICTKQIRQSIDLSFAWQSRFYDHIIRNDDEYNRIRQYIVGNPAKWQYDRENPDRF